MSPVRFLLNTTLPAPIIATLTTNYSALADAIRMPRQPRPATSSDPFYRLPARAPLTCHRNSVARLPGACHDEHTDHSLLAAAPATVQPGRYSRTRILRGTTTMLLPTAHARIEVLERRALMSATGLLGVMTGSEFPLPDVSTPAASTSAPAVTAAVHGRPVERGASHRFKVTFQSDQPIDRSALDNEEAIVVVNPDGSSLSADLLWLRSAKHGTRVVGTYRVAGIGGTFDASDNGQHRITLSADAAAALALGAAATLGTFDVRSHTPGVDTQLVGPTTPPFVEQQLPVFEPVPQAEAQRLATDAALAAAAERFGTSDGLIVERVDQTTWSD